MYLSPTEGNIHVTVQKIKDKKDQAPGKSMRLKQGLKAEYMLKCFSELRSNLCLQNLSPPLNCWVKVGF